jgi:hypothetical protein
LEHFLDVAVWTRKDHILVSAHNVVKCAKLSQEPFKVVPSILQEIGFKAADGFLWREPREINAGPTKA